MQESFYRPPKADLGKTVTNGVWPMLRWLVLLPALIVVWLTVFFIGGALSFEFFHIDPKGHHPVFIVLGSASALSVMVTTWLIAPHSKFAAMNYVYIAGTLISLLIMALHLSDMSFGPFFYCAAYAVLAGGYALAYQYKRIDAN